MKKKEEKMKAKQQAAAAKQARRLKIPKDLIDYYALYGISQELDTKDICRLLRKKQGELRSNMSNGCLNSPEIMEKLQKAYNEVGNAIRAFKNDERREEYDQMLEIAYQSGMLNTAEQELAAELYEQLEQLFAKGNYRAVIQKTVEALNNNVHDYRLYILLARSYSAQNEAAKAVKAVESGLKVHPENMDLLRTGARVANDSMGDANMAQGYINHMMEIDPESPEAAVEQSHLYVKADKQDLAYQLIDEYLEKHPNNMEFRRDVAYDMIGQSFEQYTKDPNGDGFYIASKEAYEKCLDICGKAKSIYSDSNVDQALENAKSFGQVEFNDENREDIKWLFIGALIYFVGFIMVLGVGLEGAHGFGEVAGTLFGGLLVLGLSVLCGYSGYRLIQCSRRPYWQINKFILTGEREKDENMYILIGGLLGGYMRWSFKMAIATMRWALNLLAMS